MPDEVWGTTIATHRWALVWSQLLQDARFDQSLTLYDLVSTDAGKADRNTSSF